MTTDRIYLPDLKLAVDRLQVLLANPEPGLTMWHSLVAAGIEDLLRMLLTEEEIRLLKDHDGKKREVQAHAR